MNFPTKLERQLDAFSRLIDGGDAVLRVGAPAISQWDVGQHLDHTLKVSRAILGFVAKDKEIDGNGIAPLLRAVLFVGYIPRGRGKSPEPVVGVCCPAETLSALLAEVRELAGRPAPRSKKRIFRHPFFGCLTQRQALRFCDVHNAHHHKIIREILQR